MQHWIFNTTRYQRTDIVWQQIIQERKNNEKNSQGLIYNITAGTKTITGEFTGNKDEMRAYINLFQSLSTEPSIDKINLLVKDKNGAEIIKTDIPLVPLSDLN